MWTCMARCLPAAGLTVAAAQAHWAYKQSWHCIMPRDRSIIRPAVTCAAWLRACLGCRAFARH